MLTKVKDTLPLGKQSNVVYHPLQLRPGLHWGDQVETGDKAEGNRDACERGMMEKSAVAEHAWENLLILKHALSVRTLLLTIM